MTTTETQDALRRWIAAERDGERDVLHALLTDDFVGIGPVGFVLPKAAWVDRIGPELHYERLELDEISIRDHGDASGLDRLGRPVVHGKRDVSVPEPGRPASGRRRQAVARQVAERKPLQGSDGKVGDLGGQQVHDGGEARYGDLADPARQQRRTPAGGKPYRLRPCLDQVVEHVEARIAGANHQHALAVIEFGAVEGRGMHDVASKPLHPWPSRHPRDAVSPASKPAGTHATRSCGG